MMKFALFLLAFIAIAVLLVVAEDPEAPFLETYTINTSKRFNQQGNLIPNTRNFELVLGNPTVRTITGPLYFHEIVKTGTIFAYDSSKPRTCAVYDVNTGKATGIKVIYDNYFFTLKAEPSSLTPNIFFRDHKVISIKCENLWFDYNQSEMIDAEVPFVLTTTVTGFSWDDHYRQTLLTGPVNDDKKVAHPRFSSSPLKRIVMSKSQ